MGTVIKELVRRGHELASELKADCGAVDVRSVANVLTELASALDVQSARSDALAAKLNDVCAENAALKAFGDKLDQMHNDLNGEGTGIQGRAEVACQQVALEAAMEEFDVVKTPATDAWVNEQRAVGVEMFAAHLRTNDNERSPAKLLALGAEEFAAQLRGSQV
ncbi:hypothetical protein [Escherichia coli]|uniref:hypothetical protein n=1 Tax=Escherichia coli TaxID=562 RepID=UPI001BDBECB6|nr:hypothetical protein [Escherichia coli]